jgi:hypothetical protein
MAVCDLCKGEMLEVPGCVQAALLFQPTDGESTTRRMAKIPFGQEKRYGEMEAAERCHDCGVKPGQLHHPGCDWEECPRCGGQLLACFCNDAGTFADEVIL